MPALLTGSGHATDHIHGELDGADLPLVGQVGGGGRPGPGGVLQLQADRLQVGHHATALDVDEEPARAVRLHHRHLGSEHLY